MKNVVKQGFFDSNFYLFIFFFCFFSRSEYFIFVSNSLRKDHQFNIISRYRFSCVWLVTRKRKRDSVSGTKWSKFFESHTNHENIKDLLKQQKQQWGASSNWMSCTSFWKCSDYLEFHPTNSYKCFFTHHSPQYAWNGV